MARTTRPFSSSCGTLALAFLLVAAAAARAQDTALFTARVAPNVVMVMDNSGSMNEIMWHPNFDTADATCAIFGWVAPGTNPPTGTLLTTGSGTLNDATTPTARSTPYNCDPNTRHCRFQISERSPNFVATNTVTCQNPPSNSRCGTGSESSPLGTGQTSCNSGYIERTFCGETRRMYIDGETACKNNTTWWSEEYLEWYFSAAADPYVGGLAEGNTSTNPDLIDADRNGTFYIDGATYPLYKRSRITAAKEVARDVLFRVNSNCAAGAGNRSTLSCPSGDNDGVRFGIAQFDGGNGGFVRAPVDRYSVNKVALDTAIDNFDADGSTPLAEALFQTYTYFMSRTATDRPFGVDTTTRFPKYSRTAADGAYTATPPADPLDCDDATAGSQPCSCQRNFAIVITDGLPNNDRFDDCGGSCTSTSKTLGFDVFGNLIGDYAPDPVGDPPGIGNPETGAIVGGNGYLYLDDVSKFMHDTDFRLDLSDANGPQTIDVYTVGFNIPDGAVNILERTASNANGEFYRARTAGDVANALVAAIQSIILKSRSFTSAAVPASRTSSGDNFYSAFFLPVQDSPFWSGHLKNFDFSAAGDILTADGACAIGSDPTATPPCPSNGTLRTDANGFWDAAPEMPAPGSRKLYLELGATSIFAQPTTFTIPSPVSTAVGWFGLVTADNTSAPYSTPPGKTPDEMAQALIPYLRGCTFSYSGTCTARVDGNGDPSYLGDIFHSNPVVVGSPNSAINEGSYKAFANTYRTRTRVIYAGANGGFVHGFHAGDWDTGQSPPRHDRGTGEELMGFMPYGVRNTVKNYVKLTSGLRTQVLVDGTPVVADVWFNRQNPSGNTLTTVDPIAVTKSEAQWRTVLIQGLRDGGQHYSALDITNPPASASTSTTTYPRYLWGFPAESASPLNGATSSEATWVGNTWSEPVITRVRVKAEGGSDPRGYERWVAIFGGGYHTAGDPNSISYKTPTDAGFTAKGRAIYMVDITTGKVLAKKDFDDAATPLNLTTSEQVGIKELRYAIPSAPAVFDLDFDGFTDVIYIGDLGGNLWKWVVKAPGQDPINNSISDKDPAQPDWPFRLFFRGSASTEPPAELSGGAWSSSVHYQSFFFPPTGVLRQGKLVLAFGAGERADPIGPASEYNDGIATNNNHYYVVKDADPLERIGSLPNPLTDNLDEGDLADFDASTPLTCAQMQSTKQGYFITGRDAEKFVSNSTIFLGTVFTGSFLPADPAAANPCSSKGESFLYAFDLDCGVGEFPSNPGTTQDKRRLAIGSGLPTRPRVSVGEINQGGGGGGCATPPCDCPNKIVVVTSDGEIWNDCPGSIPSSGVKVRSWRER